MRYMLLFVGLAAAPEATDAETADYNRNWGEWIGGLAGPGALVTGAPLEPRGHVVTADTLSPVELERMDIGGFAVIEAEDEDQAVEIARRAPRMALGGRTIIRPVIVVGGPASP
jgi:hypothetical protein